VVTSSVLIRSEVRFVDLDFGQIRLDLEQVKVLSGSKQDSVKVTL
jgi:hypothetical protein